jgi:hypothetical protein
LNKQTVACLSASGIDGVLQVPYLGNADRSFAEDIYKIRKTLVFFVGGCSKKASRSQGQRMRAHVVQELRRDPRARVRCKCSSCWGRELHHHVVQDMQHSQYCLVMPGDTQASRRLTEAVLAGCIPVFIGPPFHAFPMAHVVPYTAFAFFFSFNASKLWPDNTGGAEERVWLADIDIADVTIPVQSPADVLQHLEGLGDAEAKRRLSIMSLYRQYFWYQPMLSATGQQMAVDAILERCGSIAGLLASCLVGPAAWIAALQLQLHPPFRGFTTHRLGTGSWLAFMLRGAP